MSGEGKEVHSFNPWVAYGEPLHRVREFGAAPRVLDLLDERAFSVSEAAELVALVLGVDATAALPDPRVDLEDYRAALAGLLTDVPEVFDADKERMMPWFDAVRFGAVPSSALFAVGGGVVDNVMSRLPPSVNNGSSGLIAGVSVVVLGIAFAFFR